MDRMGSMMARGGPGSEQGTGDCSVPGEEGQHIWRTLGHRRWRWRAKGGRDRQIGGRVGGDGQGGGGGGAVAKIGSGFGWGNKTLDALQSMEIL